MIYFIHGPDRFLARQAAQRIIDQVDPEGANTSWFDGRDTTYESLFATVGTVSFFGGPRVVVVSDLISRAGPGKAGDDADRFDGGRPAKNSGALVSLLAAVPEDHHLVLLEPSMTAAPAALKSGSKVKVISAEPPRGAALLGWIAETAKNFETRIDRRAAQYLAETLFPQTWDRKPKNPRYDRPPDMALLTSELAKLALAAHPDPITDEHIMELVGSGPDERIFRYIDASMSGELTAATRELDRLQAAGVEPAMVMAQTLGQIELAAVAAAAGARDAGAISRDLGAVSASRLSAVMATARRRGSGAASGVDVGVDTDRRLKTGHLRRPEDALYELTIGLAAAEPSRKNDRSQ